MNNCPACSSRLLRHWSQKKVYWYCSCCRQEMPNFSKVAVADTPCRQELERLLTFSLSEQVLSQSNV